MIDFLQNFHFLRPWVLLFLLLPLGLYLKKINIKAGASSWENICDKNLLDFLLTGNNKLKKISIKKFIYTGLVFAVLSAAGPAWKKREVPTFAVENPVMFILSLAPNMQLTDISPSRLERAKFMISDITDHLEQGQYGLEVYSQEPYLITPLSDDVKLIKSLLAQITPDIVPDQGDRPDRAIDLAVERFKTAGFANGNIILFASDVGQWFELALEAVKKAQTLNYSVNVVDSSYSGSEKLKLLAQKGNGVYLSVKEADPKKLIHKISDINQEKMTLSQNLRSNYLDFGYYLLFIPLLCMLPFFRKGILIFCFMFFSTQAEAGFLLNDNQEGLRFFRQEQYEAALNKFQDPLWRGISLYKMDKHDEALKELAKSQSDVSFYNRGVILTKQCDYQKALEAFSKAAKLNPDNKDAVYNKKVLDDLFEKAKSDPSVLNCNNNQEQNQQNQNNQQNEQQQNQEQSSSSDQNEQSEQNQDKQNEQQSEDNQSSSDKQDQDQQKDQNESEQASNEDNKDKNEQQGEPKQGKNDDNPSQNDNAEGQENAEDNKQQEKGDTPDKANNDNGDENKSKNNKGNDDNGNEEQQEEQSISLMNAKKGDDNTPYDEEALAMQRRYREIPEDTGGLLREFIKKEYMKDRYNDENL
ncbi:MAG: tetratricopeptide repeat protein [Alphaproteobacteria bacterium]|nr:tetratricopeptide repeat protein [Alphaproteobacteria bacterium]